MKYLFSFLFVAFAGGMVGCQKTDTTPNTPLTASFQLLNEQGQEAAVFSQGKNVVFRFQVTNMSDQDIAVRNPAIESSDFLEVFCTTDKQSVSLGKPYSGIFCNYIGGYPYTIPAHQALTFTIAWVDAPAYPLSFPFCNHALTTYLPTGHYRTGFTASVNWHFSGQASTTATTTDFPTVAREFEVVGIGGK